MRRMRAGMRWLIAVLLGVAGCHWSEPNIKPPLHEEYVLPPADDARFSSPPAYPKETLDNGLQKKDPNKAPDPFKAPGGRFGAGPGMGGY